MAGVMKKSLKTKKKNNDILSCELIFDGGLLSSTRASLVIELIKYFLFERHQMPQPFEHIKKEVKLKDGQKQQYHYQHQQQDGESKEKRLEQEKEVEDVRRKTLKNRLMDNKVTSAIQKLELIFQNLEKSFVICPEISQIMIILGGTILSPKETFIINLPPLSPDADNLVFKSCVKAMFRQLISQDLLGDVKTITPTNMSLLLKAPRHCQIEWFVPNHTFKIPRRGKMFTYNCTCQQPVVMSHDLTHDGHTFDMSGIDCLDSIDIDMADLMLEDMSLSELLSQRVSFGHSRRSIPTAASSVDDSQNSKVVANDDNIWFQSPVSVKGYREPITKRY